MYLDIKKAFNLAFDNDTWLKNNVVLPGGWFLIFTLLTIALQNSIFENNMSFQANLFSTMNGQVGLNNMPMIVFGIIFFICLSGYLVMALHFEINKSTCPMPEWNIQTDFEAGFKSIIANILIIIGQVLFFSLVTFINYLIFNNNAPLGIFLYVVEAIMVVASLIWSQIAFCAFCEQFDFSNCWDIKRIFRIFCAGIGDFIILYVVFLFVGIILAIVYPILWFLTVGLFDFIVQTTSNTYFPIIFQALFIPVLLGIQISILLALANMTGQTYNNAKIKGFVD